MRTFRKIVIANRGEIAVRVIRACRGLGIESVAVYSDHDENALHARLADQAVRIGPAPAQDSYLSVEKIIEAAKRTGADAVHPGYGFLSENAGFAESCAKAGIVFIGPSPQTIRSMGLKSAARKLMAAAGIPIVPGYDGDDQSLETLRDEMRKIGFPVLIKASAGGGGKGMRVVRSESEADEAIEGARREAEKAFGDGDLLLEKFIEKARHVEFQIFGDEFGNLVNLFERDCSLQRRHQKIIEESPSPALDDDLRSRMGAAAIRVGKTIGYVNAGTVEFILAPSGEFYFIEVNSRLQVEHPVTEMITGLDLVKLQIEIAEGKPLRFAQESLQTSGHAIEARLYAEDPRNNFLPSTGFIYDWRAPEAFEGLRIDSGVEKGMEIGIYYDPMLAKVIAHAGDRATAIRKLQYALRRLSIPGLQTNRDFLVRLLVQPDFIDGKAHTELIAERLDELLKYDHDDDRTILATAALYLQYRWQADGELLSELPPSYRNNPYRDAAVKLRIGDRDADVSLRRISKGEFEVKVFDSAFNARFSIRRPGDGRVEAGVEIDGARHIFEIVEADDRIFLHSPMRSGTVIRSPRHPIRHSSTEEGSANSPMPGKILKILVSAGQTVAVGQPLIILEAMKMEHTMRAAAAGVVESILVKQGEVVSPGQMLIQIAAI